ncbi:MAG: Ribonuclease protein component [Candidatus Parcubacteria bacterium]|nr:Ribonuclease protein component [Candidatus Parcubacteria bacterium]
MKDGKVVHSTFFIGRIRLMPDSLRIAAVAPVKIAKTAVVRNRTRRRIYAAIRSAFGSDMSVMKSAQVILIAKAPLLVSDDPTQIQADIRSLFVKAGLLR